jgi:hypothetical protein
MGDIQYNRVSPNLTLRAFQDAVRDEMEGVTMMPPGEYHLQFYFWRQLARYLDMDDKRRQRHHADATNLQKGLEDALQGVLIDNDRNVRSIGSKIMAQGPEVEPRIVIMAQMHQPGIKEGLPIPVLEFMEEPTVAPPSANVWRGPKEK